MSVFQSFKTKIDFFSFKEVFVQFVLCLWPFTDLCNTRLHVEGESIETFSKGSDNIKIKFVFALWSLEMPAKRLRFICG